VEWARGGPDEGVKVEIQPINREAVYDTYVERSRRRFEKVDHVPWALHVEMCRYFALFSGRS
jgi:hypothetical protein